MKIAHNKINIGKDVEKKIRKLFFQKVEMKEICNTVSLSESVVRRIVWEHRWQQKRIRYYRLLCFLSYKWGVSLGEISKRSGVGYCTITKIRRQLGISKAKRKAWNKRLTKDIEEKFVREYDAGKSANKIAKKYGFKRRETVLEILKKHGVTRREPKIVTHYKEDFFENIDSLEKAYILGLIMTAGYIVKDYCGVGIQLTKKDGYILRKIAKILGSTNKVLHINCDTKRKTLPNAKDMCRLTITNRKIAEDLKKLGVVRNKSKVLEYNGCVPDKYLSHFFRGLIDGDGCIGVTKGGYLRFSMGSASKKFIEAICNIKSYFYVRSKKVTRFKRCVFYELFISGGNAKIQEILRWMYKDKGDLYLRRKYDKVQNQVY